MNRFDRQIRVPAIGKNGQEKIMSSTVLLVGCGALGSYCAEQLVRGGIKKLILVDFDHVEVSNLQRQALFVHEDAQNKTKKVIAAKKQLSRIDPTVEIIAYAEHFEQTIFRSLDSLDLILDCTDNFATREVINSYAYQQNIPFIFAACSQTVGQLMAIVPRKKPCLHCLFPNTDILGEKACDIQGILTPLIPLVTSLQISLAYKILIGDPSISWETFYFVDIWDCSFQSFHVSKNKECPYCSSSTATSTQLSELKKVCGTDVYQGKYPVSMTPILIADCKNHQGKIIQHPMGVLLIWDTIQLTLFKNGTMLIYGLKEKPDKDAFPQFFQSLQKGRKHIDCQYNHFNNQ